MLAEEVRTLIVQTIEEVNPSAFVVDLELKRGKLSTLFVRVDTDQGISLAECTELSRAIGRQLEDREDMNFAYRLEVSSPGVGFPLKLHRQYVQNIGRNLRVLRNNGQEHKGELLAVDPSSITLGPLPAKKKKSKHKKKAKSSAQAADQAPIQLAFAEIQESKVIIV
jgi:ribosome maturation factor RimP